MSGHMYTMPDPREFPRIVFSDQPDWEPYCDLCGDECNCEDE